MTVYGLFCFWSSLIPCIPVARYWDPSIPGGCINRSDLHYALAGFNILNDIALLVAPMPYLKNLQIPRKAKAVLIAVFACGSLYVFASLLLKLLCVSFDANSRPVLALWPLSDFTRYM